MTLMTIMTINAVIAPIPLMTKPHHDRSIILSFTKVAKRFQLCKFFIEEIANLPFKFSVTQGCMYLLHRVLRAVAKI